MIPALPELADLLTVRPGRLSEYHRLAHHHYRPGAPAAASRVFVITLAAGRWAQRAGLTQPTGELLVAAVVYAPPVATSTLRDQATGGRYTGWPDRRSGLLLLNREVRAVSRLVVRPMFRGLGLASGLLRATLPRLGVPRVEAAAVMADLVPVFERAGFRRITGPGTPYFLWTSGEGDCPCVVN
jgi:GNAT superfamily N-acetyltransferase